MRRVPRLFAAILAFVLRVPRLVLESGSRVDHRDAMDTHLQSVRSKMELEPRAAASEESLTLAGQSER